MFVPMAPSKTSTRSATADRYALAWGPEPAGGGGIGEELSWDIGRSKEKMPVTQSARAGALAECFTWPQFAGNRHELFCTDQFRAKTRESGRGNPLLEPLLVLGSATAACCSRPVFEMLNERHQPVPFEWKREIGENRALHRRRKRDRIGAAGRVKDQRTTC